MADITKKVDRGIPPTTRTQNFTQNDAVEGDILMIRESLGRPARKVLIEADADMAVRFNVYRKIYPFRDGRDLTNTDHLPLLLSGVQIQSDEGALISLASDETFEMESLPISDIELVTISGSFDILVI